MKNIRKYIISLLTLATVATLPVMAQSTGTEETLQQNKTATYDYETHIGEITLESYVPGEVKMVQEGKAIDVIIVMDFSGSMLDSYKSSNTFTRTVIDKIYDANNTYYYDTSSKKYKTLASISDNAGSNADKTVDAQIFSNDSGTPMTVNYKGTNYDLYAYFVHAKDNYSYPCCWLYIKVGGKRVFVRHDGSFIEESGSTTIKYWTFPTGTDGYFITPARGKDRPLFITMKEETGVKISQRIDALQSAVGKFLDMIAEHAQKTGKTDRVSTVLFQAQGKKYFPGLYNENNTDNPTDYVTASKRTYLMECPTDKKRSGTSLANDSNIERRVLIGKRFVDMSTQDASKLLKFSISNTVAFGNTPIDKGVDLGKRLMEKDGRKDDKVARYVIVFTDGEPTTLDGGGNAYTDVATPAVKNVYDLKQSSYPTNVYTIYCNSSDPKSNVSTFLDHLSSNYPKAQSYNDGTEKKDTKYFKTAKDNLEEIFDEIGQEIIVDVDEKYDVNTTMKDFINNNFFQFPNDATVADIHVYENKLAAYDKDTKKYTFSEKPEDTREITSEVTVKLKLASKTGENDQVMVFGYNYSQNWCGIDQRTGNPHGNRVLVKLPFIFKGGNDVATVPTNTNESGLYPVEKDPTTGEPKIDPETGEPVADPTQSSKYNVPEITFCTMTISRENLHRGETAIYRVVQKNEDGSETFIANVPIGGVEESTTVSKSLYGLPGKVGLKFTAEETNWNWAYDKSTTSEIKKEAEVKEESGRYYVDFLFSGKHIELNPDDPNKAASMKSHDEDFVENYINLDTLPKASE